MDRVEQIASLHSIGAGAAAEKFEAELKQVLENIRDPNTDATAKRKIVIEYVFVPQEDRETVGVLIAARSVLGATKPSSDMLYVGRKDGETIATVMHSAGKPEDPRQGVLPIEQAKGR